jgi:Fe-S oxidoreductase
MDKLKDYIYTMESCNSCGQCRFIQGPKSKGEEFVEICPIYSRYLFESYSGQGLINIAQELLEGTLAYDDALLKHIYSCLTCGACDVNCKSVRDMEVMDTILALRARCVEDGRGPMPEHRKIAELTAKSHNIYGKAHSERFGWMPENSKLSRGAETVYFVGCSSSYLYPEIARDTVKILEAGGIAFNVMNAEEYCCGAPFWRTGQMTEARKLIEHNIDALKKQNIKTLIVSCAECYGTFKGLYPRIAELDFEVLHITEVVQRLLRQNKIKMTKKQDMTVTYHDPCLLGRLSELYVPWKGEIQAFGYHQPPKKFRRGTNGVYEAPREILKAIPGIKLVEMVRNAENSFCCGGGGGVSLAFPEFSSWVANERLNEAVTTGAGAIVSCCPFCESSFRGAIGNKKSRLSYYDITRLVAGSIQSK